MTSFAQDNLPLHHYNNYDPNFLSDDEEEYCPLCIEPLDISDKNFFPCPCGYQICQFCYNNIRQNPELNGRCPACRRKYDDDSVRYVQLSPEELKIERANLARKEKERKQREKERKENENNNRKQLANMRVIQKNLVYVIGINPPVPYEEVSNVLRSDKYFGQYGKINKIVVNKKNPHSNDNYHHHSPGYGVYITYASKEDASKCINQVDGTYIDGKLVKAAYGTTKYCVSYLRGLPCQNPNCMFLHEPGEEADSLNRRELHSKPAVVSSSTTLNGGHSTGSSTPLNQPVAHNLYKSTTTTGVASSTINTGIHSNVNSPIPLKTALHHDDNINTSSNSTPALTPAHLPAGGNAWGVSHSATPMTQLNLSKPTSSSNLPTLGDALNNHSNLHEFNSNIPPSAFVATTSKNNIQNTSSNTTNNKKKNVNTEKVHVDPYDSLNNAINFFNTTLDHLNKYETKHFQLRSNLLDEEEYASYPSFFTWDKIPNSKKSKNLLRDKLVDILATKPVDYSSSVIQFLQSVNTATVSPPMNSTDEIANINTGTNNVLNNVSQKVNNVIQPPINISTPPPPGIYPLTPSSQIAGVNGSILPTNNINRQTSISENSGSTNSTDLLNQLIKGRKIVAGN